MHHDTIFGGFFDLGDDDGALVAVGFVELGELFKRVVADDVGVENKERGAVFAESLFGKFEWAGGAEGFGFDGEFDVDVVLFRVLVKEGVSVRLTCPGAWTPASGARYLFQRLLHDVWSVVDG